ncbi:MAG: thioesterase family protein [Bariatricus sp.]|nr:thioesterase family protein [Bariatricus sp.]
MNMIENTKKLNVEITGKQMIIVTEDMTAKAMGSGELPVLATPKMIALMENTAYQSVQPFLETGQGTVGTLMNVKHMAATPVGMEVTIETRLIEIDRRKLVFEVKAFDKADCIGEGIHERFIIQNEKFLAKAESKKSL